MYRVSLLIAAVMLILTAGCIKRTEKITIFQDGRMMLHTEIAGDPGDVHNGDAMPTLESGWRISDKIETDDDGDETLTRTATRQVAAGQYPASYAPAGSRLESISLRFPTTVTIEQREDGTYYHFKRTYTRRPFSFAHYFEEKIMKSDEIKRLTQNKPEEMTAADRKLLAQALIKVEEGKTSAFIEQAAAELADSLPQEVFLKVLSAASSVFQDQNLLGRVILLLNDGDEGEQGEELERGVLNDVRNAMQTTLAAARVSPDIVSEFDRQYELVRASYEITEDLGDEQWFVELVMPGKIIAHNSFSDPTQTMQELLEPVQQEGMTQKSVISETVAVEKNGQRQVINSIESYESRSDKVAWEFDGQALQDRDVVLMATSFVPLDAQ